MGNFSWWTQTMTFYGIIDEVWQVTQVSSCKHCNLKDVSKPIPTTDFLISFFHIYEVWSQNLQTLQITIWVKECKEWGFFFSFFSLVSHQLWLFPSCRRSLVIWTLFSRSSLHGKPCRIPPPLHPLPLLKIPKRKGEEMDAGGKEQGSSKHQMHWTEMTGRLGRPGEMV